MILVGIDNAKIQTKDWKAMRWKIQIAIKGLFNNKCDILGRKA